MRVRADNISPIQCVYLSIKRTVHIILMNRAQSQFTLLQCKVHSAQHYNEQSTVRSVHYYRVKCTVHNITINSVECARGF